VKGYYITLYPISEINNNGVWKKIQAQIRVLINAGFETKLLDCSSRNNSFYCKVQRNINPFYLTKHIPDDFYSCDFYYIRYGWSAICYIGLFKSIKKFGKGKIVLEMPTFPFYKEFIGRWSRIIILKDKILSKQLKKYVDRIVTYSKHEKIFDIPTIQIINGIDCSLIPVINKETFREQAINITAVAQFAKWHGYDRLINGLNNYYKQRISQKVYIHFVGDGTELKIYNKLVQQYNLSEYVIFHGLLFGKNLTEIFNKSDITVCSLGGHRKGLYLSSELKSREYLARGLPMISSTKIDVIPSDFKYCLYVPEDDSPINIDTVIQFYQNIIAQKDFSVISHEIRQFAENNCDMSITMKSVINYLSNNSCYAKKEKKI